MIEMCMNDVTPHCISLLILVFFRYARWSLGFVDPPLEVSGTGNHCKVSALNTRDQVLLEPVMDALNKLLATGTVPEVAQTGHLVKERSRQVRRILWCIANSA